MVTLGSPCPVCGSTSRTAYCGKHSVFIGKKDGFHSFYVTRYTNCRRCAQRRKEFRVEVPE